MSETVSYQAKLKSFYGTGRRKHSVARVRLYPGNGNVTINGRSIDNYFGLETLKLIVRQPLALTETEGQFDIVCTVAGGGVTGQAGAIRHGVARALLQFNAELRTGRSCTSIGCNHHRASRIRLLPEIDQRHNSEIG